MRTFVLLISLCVGLSPAAGPLELPPELSLACSEAEQQLFVDLADRRLDRHTILEAVLLVQGVSPAESTTWTTELDARVADWRASGLLELPIRERAHKLFELMHSELLVGGYRRNADSLAETLQHGWFNCVTATLLWQHLAAEFQLNTVAQQLPGHVQSILLAGEDRFVIETTCPNWFSLDAQEREQAVCRARDNQHQAVRELQEVRQLDDAGLIASVYYNRGLALLVEQSFAEALTANYAAHRLDPSCPAARANLLATLNNWALHLAEQGQTARAVSILKAGREIAPDHGSFRVNLQVLDADTPAAAGILE